jgi:hypothetical protein
MKLRILNCPDRKLKPYLIDAVQFYSKQLIPDTRIRNNCLTTIKFTDKIKALGYAQTVGYNTKKQAREFIIEMHPDIGAREIFATLAHEMVHVKQYIYNETNDSLSTWKGKKINPDAVDYWSHPWELDAYGTEPGLLYNFVTKNALWEVFKDFRNPELPIKKKSIRWKY